MCGKVGAGGGGGELEIPVRVSPDCGVTDIVEVHRGQLPIARATLCHLQLIQLRGRQRETASRNKSDIRRQRLVVERDA